jgi:hypothetical protein
MRWAALLTLLTTIYRGGEDSPHAEAGKELKVLARASWQLPVRDATPQQRVLRSEQELKAAIGNQADALLKALKVDRIDWKTQMLILVSSGTRRTGGYSVEITQLDVRDNALTVHWKLNAPKPGQPVTQALTHPAQVLLVERFEGPVRFDPPAKER